MGYCVAGLRLCFCKCKKKQPGFHMMRLICREVLFLIQDHSQQVFKRFYVGIESQQCRNEGINSIHLENFDHRISHTIPYFLFFFYVQLQYGHDGHHICLSFFIKKIVKISFSQMCAIFSWKQIQ